MPSKILLASGHEITVKESPADAEAKIADTRKTHVLRDNSPFVTLTEISAWTLRDKRHVKVRYDAVDLIRPT